MKTTNANPKPDVLLGTGLNDLHIESQEWLETIAFWKDEIRFFTRLLQEKETKERAKSELGRILKSLDKIHSEIFDYMSEDIIKHESLLARLQKGEKGLADIDYRNKHDKVKSTMAKFEGEFRDFKKLVFDYAREL
jgi:hypothetical protein